LNDGARAGGETSTVSLVQYARVAVFASAVALAIALALPTVSFRMIGSATETYSIYGGIEVLWNDGNTILATIVFLFSIVFPVIKLVGLGVLCGQGRRSDRVHVVEWLQLLGKWSMLDALIVALFVGAIRMGIASATSHAGIHVFGLSIVLSMLAAALVGRYEGGSKHQAIRMDRLHSLGSRIVTLAAGLALIVAFAAPILEVRKDVLFGGLSFANEVSLLSTARAMLSDGERLLAAGLFVLVFGASAVRSLLAMGLRWSPGASERAVRVALRLDEWSMMPVFGLGLLIVRVKLSELTTTTLMLGYWAVLVSGLLAELDAWILRRQTRGESQVPTHRSIE